MNITNLRRYECWTEVGFTALPIGWVNVFKNKDGTYYTEPCPGVLIQEATTYDQWWDEEHEDGRVEKRAKENCKMPRETRAVFVCAGYVGEPYLRPVDDDASSYEVTTTSEQWDMWQAEERSEEPKP
jgi:hypothetical protein